MNDKADQLVHQAVQLHQQGLLAQAKLLYAAALQIQPSHFTALSHMGVLTYQMGDPVGACHWLNQASQSAPNDLSVRANLGGVLLELGRFEEAAEQLTAVVERDPKNTQAYYNRAAAHQGAGAHERAVADYDRAIELQPDLAPAYSNRGNALRDLDQLDAALASYDQAIRLEPQAADFHHNKGSVLLRQKRFEQALISFETALRLAPGDVEALTSRGVVLSKLKRFDEAADVFAQAAMLAGDAAKKAICWMHQGEACFELKDHVKALACHDQALQLDPLCAQAHVGRGNVFYVQGLYEQAIACNKQALVIQPDYPEALGNQGMALQQLGRLDEAMDCFDRALAIEPDFADALTNRGLLRLSRKDFAAGWRDYASRQFTDRWRGEMPPGQKPQWDGQRLHGSLWVRGEQGVGDTVLYASMLTDLQSRVDSKKVTVDARLLPLFQRSFGPDYLFLDRSVGLAEAAYDQQIGIADLGQFCRAQISDFERQPKAYLRADVARAEQLRRTLAPQGEFVCGLAWSSPKAKLSVEKSIALNDFESVLRLPGMTFVNLQYGDVSDDIAQAEQAFGIRIHQAEGVDVFHDLDGLAALIEACDVVVSSSNSAVHLAGALGKKTFLLVPHGRGRLWYWHEDDGPSLWYPSIEVCSPTEGTDWSVPMRRISQSIQEMAHA